MAGETLSSPSVQAANETVPVEHHNAVVAKFEAELKRLRADYAAVDSLLREQEDKNPVLAAAIFFVLGLIVGLVF